MPYFFQSEALQPALTAFPIPNSAVPCESYLEAGVENLFYEEKQLWPAEAHENPK